MTRALRPLTAALLLMTAMQAWAAPDLALPFTLEAGLPLLDARIDGRQARLLIDTGGAAALALRPDWAAVAGAATTT
ncbi:MAG TPA: hypothetical protein VGE36_22935 [Roseateles sp.]